MKRFVFVFAAFALMVSCNGKKPIDPCPAGAVDLGVVITPADGPSYKLYWAKSNLSASGLCANPEDDGDYYAWGEVEPKINYTWATYTLCNGTATTLKRYCTKSEYGEKDDVTQLRLTGLWVDDAARATLHGNWRMPTDEEWTALREQCTWRWEKRYERWGYYISGNGNEIFLPASGSREGTNPSDVGNVGRYWSSSLNQVAPSAAWDMYFNEGGDHRGPIDRYSGLTIRPVSE